METVTIENVDKKQADLFKELASQLGLKATSVSIKKKAKGNKQKDTGIIKNAEILKSIKNFESGKSKGVIFNSITELKKSIKQHQSRA